MAAWWRLWAGAALVLAGLGLSVAAAIDYVGPEVLAAALATGGVALSWGPAREGHLPARVTAWAVMAVGALVALQGALGAVTMVLARR